MSCLTPFGSPDDIAAVVGAVRLAAQFGRAVDHVMAHSGAGTISIPSVVVTVSAEGMHGRRVLIEEGTDHPGVPAKPGAATGPRRTIARGFPEGVMEINPA